MRETRRWRGCLLAVALLMGGCVQRVAIDGTPCPCGDKGYRCDTSGGTPGVCVAIGGATGALSYVGSWKGYIENFHFASGSDDIAIELSLKGKTLSGSVRFGNGPDLKLGTDPDKGFPDDWNQGASPATSAPIHRAWEGFDYQTMQSSLTKERLQIGIDPNEIWKDWCSLQKPILNPSGSYHCVANFSIIVENDKCYIAIGNTGQRELVDCKKRALCEYACSCTATSCTLHLHPSITLDMVVQGNRLDGSIKLPGPAVYSGYRGGVYNVRLTRSK